jgi:hypothetical protein
MTKAAHREIPKSRRTSPTRKSSTRLRLAQAESNIGTALAALKTARVVLFNDMGGLQRARKNRRIRELEWLICDAIKAASDVGAVA